MDLADELDGYDGSVPKRDYSLTEMAAMTATPKQVMPGDTIYLGQHTIGAPIPAWHDDIDAWMAKDDGTLPSGTFGTLKDLQAQGFNTTPPSFFNVSNDDTQLAWEPDDLPPLSGYRPAPPWPKDHDGKPLSGVLHQFPDGSTTFTPHTRSNGDTGTNDNQP